MSLTPITPLHEIGPHDLLNPASMVFSGFSAGPAMGVSMQRARGPLGNGLSPQPAGLPQPNAAVRWLDNADPWAHPLTEQQGSASIPQTDRLWQLMLTLLHLTVQLLGLVFGHLFGTPVPPMPIPPIPMEPLKVIWPLNMTPYQPGMGKIPTGAGDLAGVAGNATGNPGIYDYYRSDNFDTIIDYLFRQQMTVSPRYGSLSLPDISLDDGDGEE